MCCTKSTQTFNQLYDVGPKLLAHPTPECKTPQRIMLFIVCFLLILGGPQGPCPTLISNMQSGLANSGFNPQCTPNGMFVRVQCDGVAQCLCVNETTGDILKVLNEVPQDGDFDACNGKSLQRPSFQP